MNAARHVSSNVSWFKHLTKNVSAICTEWWTAKIQNQRIIFWVGMALSAVCLFDILVVSHPVSAWSVGRHHVSSSPSSLQILLNSDVVFLDFSKAFDRVSHHHLFHKLHHYGIRGDVLDWIKNFTLNRSQHVVIDGQKSDVSSVSSGVPQGTVLAPLLFLCFINDLPNRITSKIKLYADDVLLYTTIHSQDDCHRLQQDLDTLEQWALDWKMSFRITNKKNRIIAQYTLQNQTIKEVTHAKYLGVTIDKNLSWSEHIKQITKKANNVKCFLQHNISRCPPQTKRNCYKALVKPILE